MLERIEREAGVPGLASVLSQRIAPADLRSLLLHVFGEHAARRDPASLLAQYERDATVAPDPTDARLLHDLDGLALAAAEGFESVELSPVSPFGTNAVLGGISQNNVLSTVRNTEVIADPTSALALECARRRRAGETTVRLCATAQVLRLQPIPDAPGFTAHFRLFVLVSAGRAQAGHGFELAEVAEHVRVYQRLLDGIRARGADLADVIVELSDTRLPRPGPTTPVAVLPPEMTGAAPRLLRALGEVLPEAVFDLDRREALGYYDGPMLSVTATDRDGGGYTLADGGGVPWTQRLLANGRERLITSGIGLGRIAARFL
jgi:hypothetical protein